IPHFISQLICRFFVLLPYPVSPVDFLQSLLLSLFPFVSLGQINGDKRYVYYSDARSWAYSLELCRSEHTDMAYIKSEQDMADVIQIIKTWYGSIILEKKVWIGLFSDAWMWADGSQNSFRNWLVYKPDRENCAAFSVPYKGRWVDAQCNQENTFICARSPH
uniref:C-type lectin domain-containing protein n=1 Tax=Labrus bergylta TaxID=56723 RepID=A0A3Q3E6V2_9LABR